MKVWADQDGLVIAGEDTGDDDEEGPARYGGCIALSWDAFKMDQIKVEMKDGVLKVNLPKIKVEDRKDVCSRSRSSRRGRWNPIGRSVQVS